MASEPILAYSLRRTAVDADFQNLSSARTQLRQPAFPARLLPIDQINRSNRIKSMILRKLGPQTNAAHCAGGHSCPDLFELKTGDFAIIGTDITAVGVAWLPPGSGCGPSERMVSVPRLTLVLARPDIPDSL